jgi:hypothetical protein
MVLTFERQLAEALEDGRNHTLSGELLLRRIWREQRQPVRHHHREVTTVQLNVSLLIMP